MEALLDGEGEAIMRTAIGKAKEGDSTALRLCLERLAPARRERCIQFAFPPIETAADAAKAAAALVTGVAIGELTPAEAGELGRADRQLRARARSERLRGAVATAGGGHAMNRTALRRLERLEKRRPEDPYAHI